MLGLDFCDFDNFLFLDLSLRCHETLIKLFSHLHELNLAATALNDKVNMLNAADVMKTCKNTKKMIKNQVL